MAKVPYDTSLKKEPILPMTTADRLSPGDFHVFYAMEKPQKPTVKLKLFQRYQYLSILVIFSITLMTHSWLFFEQHVMKTVITPLVLLMSTAFFGDVDASSPPSSDSSKSEGSPKTDAAKTDTSKTEDSSSSTGSDKAAGEGPTQKENTKQSDPSKPEGSDNKKSSDDDLFDPLSLDESRVKILLSLHEREKELKKMETMGTVKDSAKKALDTQLDKKIAELKELKKVIETIASANNTEVAKNIKKMVSVYEAMKPEAAARIFNELPQQVLVDLFKQMTPKKSSVILAQMTVEKAKALTDMIAFSPSVPESEPKKQGK